MSLEWLEKIVDRIIPVLVIVLGVEIVLSFVYDLTPYEHYVRWLDYVIIAFFVIDLLFKWKRVRNIPVFVRLYWLDLLAVFPFYWTIRAYEFFAGAGRIAEEGQKLVHEALLIREARIVREIEVLRVVGEEERFLTRIFAGIQRVLRLLVLHWEVAHGHIKRAHIEVHHDIKEKKWSKSTRQKMALKHWNYRKNTSRKQ